MLNGYRVLFLTTEMSEEQIEDRVEAMLVKMMLGEDFNYGRFKSGTLTQHEEEAYFELLEQKSHLEPMIIETATDVSNVSAKVEQYNPDIVFIDSVYLMEDEQGAKDDWLRVTHITRGLKALAKRKKLPVCINSQADSTTSKKTGPELENIGFSKAIGHDCLPLNTTVATDEGLKLIQNLQGEVFHIFNGESTHKATCTYAGKKEQIKISYRGSEFVCSPNHKLYVYDSQVNNFVWKRARHIEPNIDFILENNQIIQGGYPHILRVQPSRGKTEINIPIEATKELGKLIGMFIGDGSIRPYDKGQITMSCGYDKDYAEECIYLVEKYFNLRGEIRLVKTKYSKQHQLMPTWYSRAFSDWLKFFIEPNGYKTLLPQLLEMNLDFRVGLLSGLIQSDGSVKGQVEYVSIQPSIIQGIKQLCSSLGIMTKIDVQQKHPNNKIRIRLRSRDLWKAPLTLTPYKQDEYNKLMSSKANGGIALPKYYVQEIMKNTFIGDFPQSIQSSMYQARRTGKCSLEILQLAEKSLGLNYSTTYKFIPVDHIEHDTTPVDMWDIQVFSEDKRIVTNGIVTHNSDVVLGLLRDEEMIEDKEAKVKVLKQREGVLANIMLSWDFSTMDFSSIYSEEQENKSTDSDRGLVDLD